MSITLKVEDKEIILDSSQNKAFNVLELLKNNFLDQESSSSFLAKIFSNSSRNRTYKHQGIYLYGKVGRGKSMLMKNFFDNFPIDNKIYIHFNSFMQQVHSQLYKIRQDKAANKDKLIELVTKNIIKDNKLICLDEFQVDDVTDALILRRIFSYIFQQGIIVVFTSNSKPENLYQNGLQRDLFLKFVDETLNVYCQIFNLDSETDYREKFLHKVRQHYFYPINKENNSKLNDIIQHLTRKKEFNQRNIRIMGRDLVVKKSFEDIAIFNFKDLCEDNLGVGDYKEICKNYHIIFLLNVPRLAREDRNEAKRLILFIDEIYESKTILLMLANSKIEEIYETGSDAKKFKRTISRLKEIMSDSYEETIN